MATQREWTSPAGFEVSTDPARLDIERIHRFLSHAYWSPGIPRAVVERAIANSVPFGLYAPAGEQAGFARTVTDRPTYAYLADVYVEVPHRGHGLGTFLIGCVLGHPELQGLRRWALATADAHGVYARHGFAPPASRTSTCSSSVGPSSCGPPRTRAAHPVVIADYVPIGVSLGVNEVTRTTSSRCVTRSGSSFGPRPRRSR